MADGTSDPMRASDALAAMRASRAKVMQSACPPWRHALFAALMSGTVAAQALPVHVFFAVMALVFAGLVVFAIWMRAKKGVFVNGWRAGRHPARLAGAVRQLHGNLHDDLVAAGGAGALGGAAAGSGGAVPARLVVAPPMVAGLPR